MIKIIKCVSLFVLVITLSTSFVLIAASNNVNATATASSTFLSDTGTGSKYRITLKCQDSTNNTSNLANHSMSCWRTGVAFWSQSDHTLPITPSYSTTAFLTVTIPYGQCSTYTADVASVAFWSSGSPITDVDTDLDSTTVCGIQP